MKFQNVEKKQNTNLKICTLGGTEAVTKNLTFFEYGNEIIIVDCGLGFPDILDMPGVDVLIPDFDYLLQNSHKIKGLFITHGHEDHLGAVTYFLRELPQVPIYSSKLVQEILKVKLSEKKFKSLLSGTKFHLLDPSSGAINVGSFTVSAIRVNHSVPESQAYAINTPVGLLMHMGEYKIDKSPVLDKPIDLETIKRFGEKGVLCLLTDCLGATSTGSTKSESTLSQTFLDLFTKAGKKQLFVTTISSNVSRMYQIIDAAIKHGRKVVPSGRSIEQIVKISKKLGHLPFADDTFVSEKESASHNQSELVYLIAGCYGQYGSSLGKLSRGEHDDITLNEGAHVIFSGDPAPPGTDITVEKLTDALILKGVEIVYGEIQENLHVSGHGTREDLVTIAKLLNPKFIIPLGGTVTKMRAYRDAMVAEKFPVENIFECLEGDSVEFIHGKARKGKRLETKQVFINTSLGDKVNPAVVQDRDRMAEDGLFVVVIPSNKNGDLQPHNLEIVTRGFVYVKDSRELLEKTKKLISKKINSNPKKAKDWKMLRRKLEGDIQYFLRKETRRKPMVIVHSLRI